MTPRTDAASFETAWKNLGAIYPADSWFRDVHLAEGKGRFQRIVRDLTGLVPPDQEHPVVDVGCYNGFLSYLLHQFGYVTSGIDGIADQEVPERAGIIEKVGGKFYRGNFNDPEPFPDCPKDRFSAAIVAGVMEVTFNHPSGLLEKTRDLLVRDGILVLSAINPHTLANAVRMFLGRSTMEGDAEFATTPKLGADGRIISHQPKQLVYREYPQALLAGLLEQAGFTVLKWEYFGARPHPKQPRFTRLMKANPLWSWMEQRRLFGSGIHLVARRTR